MTSNPGSEPLPGGAKFIYLFIYDKGPESATGMPITVNSKLTHYKIRQIGTENKRFKNRQTAKKV